MRSCSVILPIRLRLEKKNWFEPNLHRHLAGSNPSPRRAHLSHGYLQILDLRANAGDNPGHFMARNGGKIGDAKATTHLKFKNFSLPF